MIYCDRIEIALRRLNPISLDVISCLRLMNRIEIKYVFTADKLTDLLNMLAPQYPVLEIDNMRGLPYSTTYFDTEDSLFYYQHVRGKSDRYKIRYRKYEVTNTSFLEIKKKTNKGRMVKWRIQNEPFPGSFDHQAASFIHEHLNVCSTSFKPALRTNFKRITLAGVDLKERITIDYNITFSDPQKRTELSLPYLAIAEIKKEAYSDYSHFRSIIKQLKIYPTGFSKYCVGSALLNDSLKKNMIKPKILLLNRLENEYTWSDYN
jgi:hypothetical protein